MTEDNEDTALAEDGTISEEESMPSSISRSLGECSVRLKEIPKPPEDINPVSGRSEDGGKKWWLKRPETRLGSSSSRKSEAKSIHSPEGTSSMREFLEKEKYCRVMHKEEADGRDKDDTLCDILASTAFDKYPEDFENATDEDIGSFLEEMSKIAGALSPNSAPERTKSLTSSKNHTEEEKSVEELLQEAEKLVRENVSLSKSSSRSETLMPSPENSKASKARAKRLEDDIFNFIQQQVHKESEKMRKSPRSERQRPSSPEIRVTYEAPNSLKPPTPLELQKKHFEDQKVEVSSSSDLDDPIERHSNSEDLKSLKKSQEDKVNLQKEITDVDKDFFDDLLKKSKEKMEGGLSGSSSFGQEDFSHFLKILQGKSDLEGSKNFSHQIDPIASPPTDPKSSIFPEKEITEILKKELTKVQRPKNSHEIVDSDSSASNERSGKSRESVSTRGSALSRNSSRDRATKAEIRKVPNSETELYTVGLTPRLELFADAIPKLMAEKSVEIAQKNSPQITPRNSRETPGDEERDREIFGTISLNLSSKAEVGSSSRGSKPPKPPDRKFPGRWGPLGPSRSYDQLPHPMTSFRSSLDDVRNPKPPENLKKPPLGSRTVTKNPKIPSRPLQTSSSKVKLSLKPTVQKQPLTTRGRTPETMIKRTLAGGDNRRNFSKSDYEALYLEEKHKTALMRDQIEAEAKLYKQQIHGMRESFEEELFILKKQNIILTAKVDELTLKEATERRTEIPGSRTETRVNLLEKELERQESLIRTYETENKRLMVETKRQQEEIKNLEQRQRFKDTPVTSGEVEKLNDTIKDLREEILKLNLEASDLRQKNSDLVLKHDDVVQQNSLLQDELTLFKEQLKSKDKFITDRLQSMRTEEMETRRKMEEMRVELSSKTEKLRLTNAEFEEFQRAITPLEKELLELRVKEQSLQEKLQLSRSHVEREKVLTQKLKDQVILDNKKILDLNRQVREMERILKRKNPDSVSALILTAKSDHERINLEKIKLLEDRIASLEGELRAKEEIGQEKLSDLQQKFAEMKDKYSSQVSELEEKLREAASKPQKSHVNTCTQTMAKITENKSVEAKRDDERLQKFSDKEMRNGKPNLKSQNPKEDAHLIATIRGLKLELANKDKSVQKFTKDVQELQKTNRRLQKERERLLNDRRSFRPGDTEKLRGTRPETSDQNSNVCLNGHLSNGQKFSGSSQKLYDPLQFSENGESSVVKRLTGENEILKEELSKMNKDYMTLKNKRLHDLNLLQEEHEREVASLVKEYSVKFGDSKVVKLQGQINTQIAIISHLKEQIDKLQDYKEQVIVLKVEREHLESKVKILNEKVKYLSTPGTEQLQLLQDKITILQQRHESREMTLQNLVRDLLRNRTLCRDCKGEKGKSKQLCYFRQELDHILGMLQEIANV
ncbi:centrosomal protein of 162 kDa [Diachasma alloeum]|uniref:centrosomal protein of 162 kDa n=1 Tax=Diachasma alloeum TaxID=454923 RepID=UPI0007381153|nr:centrosomal protein of 162 kDa [Diachasma alloeum]